MIKKKFFLKSHFWKGCEAHRNETGREFSSIEYDEKFEMEVENFAQAIVDNIFDQKNASSDVDDVSDFGVLNSVVSAAEMAVAAVLPLNSVSELESFDESNFDDVLLAKTYQEVIRLQNFVSNQPCARLDRFGKVFNFTIARCCAL